jgi:hypothetical protein
MAVLSDYGLRRGEERALNRKGQRRRHRHHDGESA